MADDQIAPKPLTQSAWFKWSWPILLAFVILQSLSYHCRLWPTSASGYFARGRSDFFDGEYEDAVKNLTRSIEKKADDAESYIWRGVSYVKLHQYEKARPDLLKALELAPTYAKSHAAYADYYVSVGDRDAAIKEFTAALEHDPKYGRSYLERGQLHFDAGRWTEAAADFRQAASFLDDDQQALAYVLLWLSRVKGGDAAAATTELKATVAGGDVAARWFGMAVDFLTGDKTQPDFITDMAGSRDQDEDKLEVEAYFIAGEKRLIEGDRPSALALLREIIRSEVEESYAFDRARAELQKSFLGLEAMRLDDDSLTIVSVIPGGPAEAAGITPGSTVETIDDEPADRDVYLDVLASIDPGLEFEFAIAGADGAKRVATLEIPLTLETSAPTK